MGNPKIENILNKVIKNLTPTSRERNLLSKFSEKLIQAANKYHSAAMLCGSVAKDTYMPKRNEFDLFLLFKEHTSRQALENTGLKIAKSIVHDLDGKYTIAYAEHPYLRSKIPFEESIFDVDIVPCYDVTDPSKIISSVDRTPHHVKYILKTLKPEQKVHVRLLKQFCKVAECYGADLRTQGFSGYLCELLIINSGNFENIISEIANWEPIVLIDISKKIKPACAKKFHAPLIVIDPVDPNRNVAAAVSAETFIRFKKYCKEFLNHPDENLFYQQNIAPYTIQEIEKEIMSRKTRLYITKIKRPKSHDDIVWSQLVKATNRIAKIINENGFKILDSDCWMNEKICIILLEAENWQIPKIYHHYGPNIYDTAQVSGFLKRYKTNKILIKNEEYAVELEREHTILLNFLHSLSLKSKNMLMMSGIPSKIASEFQKAEIKSGSDAIKLIFYLPLEFQIFLTKYFKKNFNIGVD